MKKPMIICKPLFHLVLIIYFSISFNDEIQAQVPESNDQTQASNAEKKIAESPQKNGKAQPKSTKTKQGSQKIELNQSELIDKVQSFYAQAQDFQADFTQTYTYKIYGRKKLSTGKVFFKKPARMRWDYEVPTPRVFIADGKTLWVYEPEEAQVFKRDLSSAQLPVALRFMQGKAKLDDEFDIETLKDLGQGVSELSLKPKRTQSDFKTLRLKVKSESGEVLASTLVDATGNLNEIKFVAVKVNQGLPNSGFSFTPPEGVRVIDEHNMP